MSQLLQQPTEKLFLNWSHWVHDLLGYQWKLWRVQCQIGIGIMESVLTSTPGESVVREESDADVAKLHELERLAGERARRGLPPPREIYDTPYRERINWAAFPAWARPTDPELFEECSHEG